MSDVDRVGELTSQYADAFAEACRSGRAKPARDTKTAANDAGREGQLVRVDAQPDECAAFLRALDQGLVHVKPTGRFWATTARRTSRNLHLVGRSGTATALHTEYLIHIGAYAELILDHGWAPASLDFECGAFDVEGGDHRLLLLVEAKARVDGPTSDTLKALRNALLSRARDPSVVLSVNHRNKWDRLVVLTKGGPVWLWLVADDARWSYVVRRHGDDGLEFIANDQAPHRDRVLELG